MSSPREQAFTILYLEEADRVERFVYRRVRHAEDAQDIVQEVWTRLHLRLQRTEPLENPQAWLMRVARNLTTDYYRKAATSRAVFLDGELQEGLAADYAPTPEEHLDQAELKAQLEEGLSRLSPAHRQAFVETELEGRSFQELSQTSEVKLGTLLSRKHYAVRMLRSLLKVVYEEFKNTV